MASIGRTAQLNLHRKRTLKIFSVTLCKIGAAAKTGNMDNNLMGAGAALNKDPRSLEPEHCDDLLHDKGKPDVLTRRSGDLTKEGDE